MRSRRAAALALAAAVGLCRCGTHKPAAARVVPAEEIPPGDWPQYRRDLAGCSDAAGGLESDPASLRERWQVKAGKSTYAQAVVAGDAAYLTTTVVGSVVALDLATGATRWSRDFDATTSADCEGAPQHPGTWGSAAIDKGVVYAASPPRLTAIRSPAASPRSTSRPAR